MIDDPSEGAAPARERIRDNLARVREAIRNAETSAGRPEGSVALVSEEEANAYFATRPRESQIGAWASIQSQPIEHAKDLAQRVADYEKEFEGREVPRPSHWSGFRLRPERIEFWKSRPGRLHERHLYIRSGESWTMETLYP